MEDLRMCSRGHALEPLAQWCNFGHETCIRLKCPTKECTFSTKPAIREFKDLLQSEIDEHLSDCQKESHKELTESKENHHVAVERKEGEDDAKMNDVNEDLSEANKKLEKKTCPLCYKLFYSTGNMRAHVKSHHDRKGRFNCQSCEKTYSSKNALQYHEKRSHSNGGEIACENCDETFCNFEGYSTHRKSHRSIHYQLDQTCEECGKIIRGKHNLNQHLKEIHSLETSYNVNKVTVKTYPHTCDQCDAVFKRKSHLNSHVQGMHGWGKYPCSQCGKEFKNKSNLNRHVKNIHK